MTKSAVKDDVVVAGFNLTTEKSLVPCLTENGLTVLTKRYLDRDENGFKESPLDLFKRVATTAALVDEEPEPSYMKFLELMITGRFMPNSPTLMNAGRKFGMMSACFVLPIKDSLQSILETQRAIGLIQASGGGTGFTLDNLRATGDFISSSGGTTSGPISFWRSYSATTDAIQQGAFRRGANMMMMSVRHPDILKFLFSKQNLSQFVNYNISVKIPDSFMEDLNKDRELPLIVKNPRTGKKYVMPKGILQKCINAVIQSNEDQSKRCALDACYGLQDLIEIIDAQPKAYEAGEYVSIGDIWDMIVKHAWTSAEPGLCFIDRVRESNPTPHIGELEASNPCGEQYLLPYEACNLGSVNLAYYVKRNYVLDICQGIDPDDIEGSKIDWDALERDIELAVRFLDNIITANKWPLKEIEETCMGNRKIGLGVMGFADALFKLGIPYSSKEALQMGKKFMKFINDKAIKASMKLAKERGTFPFYQNSTWEEKGLPVRNAEITTCAPTGTVSIIANCSGGIEPIFNLVFIRTVLNGTVMYEVNPWFKEIAEKLGVWSDSLAEKVATEGTVANCEEIPAEIRKIFTSTRDISPEQHVRMQATFQKHVTNSISKTINLPADATEKDVENAYLLAHKLGCKGITVYRDGSRKGQPMALKGSEKYDAKQSEDTDNPAPTDVPHWAPAFRITRETVFGSLHINIVYNPETGEPLEIFAQLGRAGEHVGATLEAICRMASMWLRANGDIQTVIHQLLGIGSTVLNKANKNTSLPNELALALLDFCELKAEHGIDGLTNPEVLKEFANKGKKKSKKAPAVKPATTIVTELKRRAELPVQGLRAQCPTPGCTGYLVYESGCSKCPLCGYSPCS